MVNFENLLTPLPLKIRPFGPASDKPSDCFGFCGRLQLFGKIAKTKEQCIHNMGEANLIYTTILC